MNLFVSLRACVLTTVIASCAVVVGCGGGALDGGSFDRDEGVVSCDDGSLTVITAPANGETGAARNVQIVIILPDGVSTTAFDLDSFSVASVDGEIAGSVTADEGSGSIAFAPTNLLPPHAVIRVSVLHDACGDGTTSVFSFSFTTGNDPDGVAPKVVASSILDGAVGVAVNAQLTVYFDEALAPASVNASNIQLEQGGIPVAGTVSYDATNHSASFKPLADLAAFASYELRIQNVTDMAGNAMESVFAIEFTTGAAPDTTPPATPTLSKKAYERATLTWTAPGDDGNVGTAAVYRMRYSVNPITTEAQFDSGTPVGGLPIPQPAGTIQEVQVAGMTPADRYFFALKAIDVAGNESGFVSFELNVAAIPVFAIEAVVDENINEYMGRSVAGGCDVNHDGFDDVVVGIPYDDNSGAINEVGKVVVYLGDDDGSIGTDSGDPTGGRVADIEITGFDGDVVVNTSNRFGWSVACSGDYNGDGYDDILVGAPYVNSYNRVDAGAAYLFYGKDFAVPTLLTASDYDVVVRGTIASDFLGWSVNFIGDIDGDGKDDLGTTARGGEIIEPNEGIGYIFYGADNPHGTVLPDAAADITVEGEVTGTASYGLNLVTRGGDVDGDGLIDLAFASTRYPLANRGRAYIYLGKHGYPNYIDLDTDADIVITGEADGDYLGGYPDYATALAIDGDINGDGIDDIVVGVPYEDTTFADAGAVYAFFGRSDWSTLPAPVPSVDADIFITGIAASDYFGISLDPRSDFNHDGIDDMLVGAYRFDNGVGGDRGGAFVFYGNLSPVAARVSTDAEVIISNEGGLTQNVSLPAATLSTSDYWGQAVSTVGDINGDGYGDVVIGGPYNNTAGRPSNTGAAYIIY